MRLETGASIVEKSGEVILFRKSPSSLSLFRLRQNAVPFLSRFLRSSQGYCAPYAPKGLYAYKGGTILLHVLILGTRGIPSKHSGFETFAQDLALFLRSSGHQVTVYCQEPMQEARQDDIWKGIRRVRIPAGENSLGTIIFDWKAVRHSMGETGVVLTLGYNTGIFNVLYRFTNLRSIMNMDGVEWRREKWSLPARAWFWFNEWAGARVSHHMVADHPEIQRHLCRHTDPEKITMIPYGANSVRSAPSGLIEQYNLTPDGYYLLIARPEPENSILEIVQGYSLRPRGIPLVVLGNYRRDGKAYQKKVLEAAGPEVKFLGAIFERDTVRALRFYARAYFHGHRVGGTNPSLVESLAAGNPVIAHDNPFTRWVAGEGARYFRSFKDISEILDSLDQDPSQLQVMKEASYRRHIESFTQEKVLTAYTQLLLQFAPAETLASSGA
jgi:glycosyltransferase involved in cell wall biosynthesis